MIGQLTGKVAECNPPVLLLLVGGVGYEVFCPLPTFYHLKKDQYTLFTQLVVRDDAHILYGFSTNDEKLVFNELLKVSGVGAKVALAILSTLSIDDIFNCIAGDDFAYLQQTPGIGKKTAQKIIVELKDRLPKLNLVQQTSTIITTSVDSSNFNAALGALTSLGFKVKEAKVMLAKVDMNLSTEAMIKAALKNV